jgi:hypothetical protein
MYGGISSKGHTKLLGWVEDHNLLYKYLRNSILFNKGSKPTCKYLLKALPQYARSQTVCLGKGP